MEHLAKVSAARGAYYSIKDVIGSIPPKDTAGGRVDPRLQFEAVADAQGMEYLALAGYDTAEAAKGWEKLHRIAAGLAKDQEANLGAMAEQMRAMQQMMEVQMRRMRESLGGTALVQTIPTAPPTRSRFVATLTNLEEVRAAAKAHGAEKKEKEYLSFLTGALLPRAAKALEDEQYGQAARDCQVLYDRGVRTAPVVCGLAKSTLGGFAFAASAGKKKKAEALYREALKTDAAHAPAQRGLGELYEDSERYAEAAAAYRAYLKLAPKAKDRKKIERKATMMERKAAR
jgi:tetratricopeptide (TPR) repeat protein